MWQVDGAQGEGGGQLLRTALALAAATGTPLHIENIRAARRPPGLAPQHLAAAQAVAALSDGRLEGAGLRSSALSFWPGATLRDELTVDVGTAGNVILILHTLLPVLAAHGRSATLRLTGGTDVRASPPFDYLQQVTVPLLGRLGLTLEVQAPRRGYYPRGGGMLQAQVVPCPGLRPLQLVHPGRVLAIGGLAHVTRLPLSIAGRMATAAGLHLPQADIRAEALDPSISYGPGGAVVVWAHTEHSRLGAAAVAERGVPAEALGEAVGAALAAELAAGASLDVHAADQLLVYLALAGGRSLFRARELSSHARTTLGLLHNLLGTRAQVQELAGAVQVELEAGHR